MKTVSKVLIGCTTLYVTTSFIVDKPYESFSSLYKNRHHIFAADINYKNISVSLSVPNENVTYTNIHDTEYVPSPYEYITDRIDSRLLERVELCARFREIACPDEGWYERYSKSSAAGYIKDPFKWIKQYPISSAKINYDFSSANDYLMILRNSSHVKNIIINTNERDITTDRFFDTIFQQTDKPNCQTINVQVDGKEVYHRLSRSIYGDAGYYKKCITFKAKIYIGQNHNRFRLFPYLIDWYNSYKYNKLTNDEYRYSISMIDCVNLIWTSIPNIRKTPTVVEVEIPTKPDKFIDIVSAPNKWFARWFNKSKYKIVYDYDCTVDEAINKYRLYDIVVVYKDSVKSLK